MSRKQPALVTALSLNRGELDAALLSRLPAATAKKA
jgi:hypothetical protein